MSKQWDLRFERLRKRIADIERKLGMAGGDPYTCSICGKPAMGGQGDEFGAKIGYCKDHWPQADPPLPLHARVAKALGWEHCCIDHGVTGMLDDWMGYAPNILRTWSKIPDYPNELAAAMGALEEYKTISRARVIIKLQAYASTGLTWCVYLDNYGAELKSLPQAICEAIVKHAEGK